VWRPGDFATPGVPARWFGRQADLWTEIGFGSGDFLCDLAAEHPEINLLGIEMSPTCHRKALRQARDRNLHNLQLVVAPAEFVLRDIIPRQTLDRVYINFPSPWPKRMHEERRLLTADFWTVLADRVAHDGPSVQVTTDRPDYLDYARGEADAAGWFSLSPVDPPARVCQTKYARQAREEGRSIQTIRASRVQQPEEISPVVARLGGQPSSPRGRPDDDNTPAASSDSSQSANTMHHAVLRGRFPSVDSFEKRVRHEGERTSILMECLEEAGGDALVFAGHTEEPDLTQQILIEVIDRSELADKRGDLLVRMRPFNRPLVTEATRVAVDMVVNYLVDELQVAELIDRKY
jgi:tRNA (guanine-N7-)-methyltransferase